MEPKEGYRNELKSRNTSIIGDGGSRDITIDMGLLESSLKQKIEAIDPFMSPNCCIFKTPKILLRHNENAFHPIAFSIGPIHHGKENLKATEKIKHKYMQGLVDRSELPLIVFIEAIEKIEKEARDCYAEPIGLSKEAFVEMLVLDGCFIIELFHRDNDKKLTDADDPIFTTYSWRQCLHHDLILLENQIPWKVLELLFHLTGPSNPPLDQLAILFFRCSFTYEIHPHRHTKLVEQRSKHILDLLRNWLVLSSTSERVRNEWQPFPSATYLKEAGVKFKVTPDSILDVKFTNNGTLEIPFLVIHEHTETFFRNLISFEQSTPNYSPIITSYVILMDNLINTTKDLEILCEKKIIYNWLDPKDAAQSFNKLYDDTYVEEFYYVNLCHQVNEHCKRHLPKWRAYIVHNYCTPWGIVGLLIGGTAWILTLLQTIYTFKP